MLRHILIKLPEIKHDERTLKAAREKQDVTYKGNAMWLTNDFQQKLCRPEGNGRIYLKYWKKERNGKNIYNQYYCTKQGSFKIDGEIKNFTNKG